MCFSNVTSSWEREELEVLGRGDEGAEKDKRREN